MKRKLLLAMLCIVGCLSVHAQKDVTSQYITNATLSNGTSGWTVSNFNGPVNGFHQNVNNDKIYSNATPGYASEAYAGWGNLEKTSYSLTQKITLPAGNYTLVNYSFFRQGQNYDTDASKSLANLKAGEKQVAIKTLGSIFANGYANSQWEGACCFDAKMYRNTLDFTIDADDTEIEIGLVGTFDEMRSWCIAGMFELIDNGTLATMDAPYDVTGYLTNSGFEYRNMEGWTLSEDKALGVQNNNQEFKTAWCYAEKWQPSSSGALSARSMSQTLTKLPAGLYRLKANLGGDGTYIGLNEKTVKSTADGDYTVSYILAENEDLVVTAGKTAEGTANWIHFDNFKLLYCGDVQAALTTSLGKKTSYSGLIPTAAYNQLLNDVAPYDKQYNDVDELLAAIDAVENLYTEADKLKALYSTWLSLKDEALAVATGHSKITAAIYSAAAYVETLTTETDLQEANNMATALIANYVAWDKIKKSADALVAVSNDNTTANSTLSQAISDQAATISNADVSSKDKVAEFIYFGITGATSALKMAMITYVGIANPVGENAKFDCTFMLTNPDLTGLPTWTGAEGWATEQNGGNSQVMTNGNATSEDGKKTAFYEYWNNPPTEENVFALYQEVKLPVGTYNMSCYAFAQNEQNNQHDNIPYGVYFYANNVQGSAVNSARLSEQSIEFVNDDPEQNVKIGLKPVAGNGNTWMGIGYVQLFKVPTKEFVIDETVDYDNTQSGAGKVTLNRNIKAGLNTLVLPFSMTQDEVEAKFGAGSQVYVVDGFNGATIYFAKSTTGIAANVPCILQATEAGTSYEIEGRTLVASTTATQEFGDLSFIGTYKTIDPIPEGNYILFGGSLYLVDSPVSIKGTRAYFYVGGSNAREIAVVFEGSEATGIAEIDGEKVATGVMYNLAGQVVGDDYKGIVIIDGKKVLK